MRSLGKYQNNLSGSKHFRFSFSYAGKKIDSKIFFISQKLEKHENGGLNDSSLINPFCISPMIYAPVCACNGLVYSNSCLAQCDGNTIIGPVDPTLVPGQPCSLSACDVNIIGDSIACNYPVILEVASASLVSPFIYSWWDNSGSILSTGNLFTVAAPGMYYVSVTDANGCTDTTSINMQHMSMTIYSIPNPPNICLGDSIYLVHDTSFVNTIWLNSPQSSNPAMYKNSQHFSESFILNSISSCEKFYCL